MYAQVTQWLMQQPTEQAKGDAQTRQLVNIMNHIEQARLRTTFKKVEMGDTAN